MTDWVWIEQSVLFAVHDEQILEHGGVPGVRNPGLLESALARPRNLLTYGTPDFADLAASLTVGLSRNHAFVDGNKRTAFVALELFLTLNGHELTADDAACVHAMLAVASGEWNEAELAVWIRSYTQAIE
jgi:death-on-curing protein